MFKLGVFLSAALLAACTTSEPQTDVDVTSDALSAHQRGVDYSFSRPSLAGLHAEGYTFVQRYFSFDEPDTHGKILFPREAKRILSHGLAIISGWEYGSQDALGGYDQGVADAKEAEKQASDVGAPPDRPIYFAVDFDATPGQQDVINRYLDGAASVIGRGRVGIYGGYYPVKRALDAGKATWAWQTYAWSGGQWDDRAQLRQTENGITAGGDPACDLDGAEAIDFGQWSNLTQIVDRNSGKCIDVRGDGSANGTNVQLWECNGEDSQAFVIEHKSGGNVVIKNAKTGKCIDVRGDGSANGTNVQQWECNGTDAQLFAMNQSDGHVTFVNANGKCLDVTGADNKNGTNIEVYRCHDGSNQHFRLVASPWAFSQARAAVDSAVAGSLGMDE